MPHTPGPWRAESTAPDDLEFDVLGPNHVDEGDCQYITTVLGMYCPDESRSNARLIAQAPAMYELLKEVEWSSRVTRELGHPGGHVLAYPSCGFCLKTTGEGHSEDCRLAAVLKAVEGT